MSAGLFYGVILLALVGTLSAALLYRRFVLRPIEGYQTLRLTIDRALETNTAVHVSFGASALREESTLSAIASAGVLYYVAARATLADRPTITTMSDPVTLGLGQDTLRRAYRSRGALNNYVPSQARWYPSGPLSLAFAAGVGAEITDSDVYANILTGRFGVELMLMAEQPIRYNRPIVAHSDRIDGLAVAYVVSETPLLGEELYAGSGYLDPTPLHVGGVIAQDLLRFAVIIGLIVLAAMAFSGVVK
ncbi:MAG TPA: DUF6754 domain-containing protein [Aggregatilineales bacterium]|nr:DUF6754 domain-containing protein [Aggregatilineales bacterium]